MKKLETKKLTFYYREPENTPVLKTILFFSLSAHDSLNLSPFCHPVETALKEGARVISVTLPNHENNARPYGIQEIWKKEKENLKLFLNDLAESILELKKHFPTPFGAMGISRGAFVALFMGSMLNEITTITCFAPLLFLKGEDDFSILNKIPSLIEKKIHFFVGDKDTSIGTEIVVKFQKDLENLSKGRGKFEIKVSPSIGRFGHGTSDEAFTEGAKWLINNL